MKLEDYKGYEIHVNEKGIFEAMQEFKPIFTADKLQKLKDKINETEKQKVSMPAIRMGYGWRSNETQFDDVTISTITESKTRYGKYYEAWVTLKGRNGTTSREKVQLQHLFKPTAENRKIIGELNELSKQEKELTEKVNKLKEKLVNFQPEDFGYKEK